MAIYHFNTQPISRSQGRSIVACAAYRAGEQLTDQRDEKVHDYRRKQGVAYKEILLPEEAPKWMQDRSALWNHVEAIEKRKDARLAREIQFALPRELTFEQNQALAREFVQQTFVQEGMVADLCLHWDKGADGREQPHCHVLLSTRQVSKQGFGLKNVQWDKKEQLQEWRAAWANTANAYLAKYDHELKIDHRSNREQQIELEPQYKLGTAKLSCQAERLAAHQRIARANGERIYEDPQVALDALTKQQSTFTKDDLARFVNRHTEDAAQFQQVYARVELAESLVQLGQDQQGRERFTTQAILQLEATMLKNAKLLSRRGQGQIEEPGISKALTKRSLSAEQETALRYLVAAGDLKCVLGYAGTGKSYMLEAAREIWEQAGYQVQGVALSGIATQNLAQSSGIKSRTSASLFYSWEQGHHHLKPQDILVIDEAGMLGSRQLAKIMEEAQTRGAKVVILGDWQQLQAIEAGAAFRAIAEANHYIELQEVRRQTKPWQQEATVALAKGQVGVAFDQYKQRDHLHHFETQTEAKEHLIQQWEEVRQRQPAASQLIMAYTRQDVQELNHLARARKEQNGELGPSQTFEMSSGEKQLAPGDRVYFLKRDDALGVINGTLGTIEAIKQEQLAVKLDSSSQPIVVDTKRYKHLDHGYAATVYKAQGVTVDHAYLLTSTHYDAHSTYVGMSRHRQSCDLYSSQEQFQDGKALRRTLGRARLKDVTLDYPQSGPEYARQREIAPHPHLAARLALHQRLEQRAPSYEQQMRLILKKKYQAAKAQFWCYADKFIKQFERRQPALAKQISESLVPEHERQATAYLKQFQAYRHHSQELLAKDRQAWEQLTKTMMGSSAVMNHISRFDQELASQIKQTFKDQEQARKYERSFSRGFGF